MHKIMTVPIAPETIFLLFCRILIITVAVLSWFRASNKQLIANELRMGRKLVCECEMLRDDEKRRRIELEKIFGVDFGGPGERGLELV
jgi:hypothetical protein